MATTRIDFQREDGFRGDMVIDNLEDAKAVTEILLKNGFAVNLKGVS